MSYRDPYAGQYGHYQYGDAAEYNPYTTTSQPHATYENGPTYDNNGTGYRDFPPQDQGYANTQGVNETSGFERGEFGTPREEKIARNFREYRMEYKDNLWTKGGRTRCIGRICCCTILIAIFLVISIILALALWIRPPSVKIGSAGLSSTSASAVQLQDTGITVPLEVNISVNNPNYFSIDLKKLSVALDYPLNGNETNIGNGTLNDVVFHANSNTSITFPFNIDYEFANDPQFKILLDMAEKCGVLGNSKSNLNINYKITIGLHILVANISPTVSNTFSIACPFDESTLQGFIDKFGLGSLLGGSS